MTEPDLNTLALGTDLTTLGLNLNSTEVLYATFSYPCHDQPTKRDPDYVLPYCYYMQPPALKTSHLTKFKPETLFYIFYNMPKDTLQVYAAKELYNRGWKYHKELKLWFTREDPQKPGATPTSGTGPFWFFDITTWDKKPFRDTSMVPGGLKFMSEEEYANLNL
jgi:CCR4-NOT transcription complex subunit 2